MNWIYLCKRPFFIRLINFIGVIEIVISNFGHRRVILNRHAMVEVTAQNINTTENPSSELANFFLENVVTLETEALKEQRERVIQDTYKKSLKKRIKKRFASLRLGDPMVSEFFTAVKTSEEIVATNAVSGINTVQLND
ncbi:hypothetical protein [Iodobacter fluviatilis]|uniref:Uncharacterized protein n=1 Tax=Iodobacter fluviatilis TaxID=537 RepID=A0A377Q4N4_9NEIS|nr:hypothetical protein [Iodobacter fluviatilis]TCU80277.1 hypothetical protein EV682_13016 [Iodobacter fluviatilis]STQ90184.1 Uncharacterised protein [Iodobacter fluviatilis]